MNSEDIFKKFKECTSITDEQRLSDILTGIRICHTEMTYDLKTLTRYSYRACNDSDGWIDDCRVKDSIGKYVLYNDIIKLIDEV